MDLLAVLLPVVLSASPAPKGVPPELGPLRESLQRTRSLSARFEQTKHLKALRDTLVTTGRLSYRRGGRLVWHTDPPSESELVLEGTAATLTMSGMSSPQSFDLTSEPGMGKVFQTLRAVLEADLESLLPLFELRIDRARPLRVSLKPRSEALSRSIQAIELEFDPEYRLRHVSLQEPDGDRTDIAFRDHVIEKAGR